MTLLCQVYLEFFRLQHFLCIGEQQLGHRTPLSILLFLILHIYIYIQSPKSAFLSFFAISPNLKILCFCVRCIVAYLLGHRQEAYLLYSFCSTKGHLCYFVNIYIVVLLNLHIFYETIYRTNHTALYHAHYIHAYCILTRNNACSILM